MSGQRPPSCDPSAAGCWQPPETGGRELKIHSQDMTYCSVAKTTVYWYLLPVLFSRDQSIFYRLRAFFVGSGSNKKVGFQLQKKFLNQFKKPTISFCQITDNWSWSRLGLRNTATKISYHFSETLVLQSRRSQN